MKSMTGFGRGTFGEDLNRVVVTIKTYNSRFLDMKVRGCESEPAIEAEIREFLQNNIVRGTAYVTIEPDRKGNQRAAFTFNRERFEEMDKILMTIQKDYGRHLEISDLGSSIDLISQMDTISFSSKNIKTALTAAYKQIEGMRTSEGSRLKDDISQRLILITGFIEQIAEMNSNSSSERQVRYTDRIKNLLENMEIDEARVAQEIALLAERSDITEEVIRSRSHIEQFISLMDLDEPVGKRFNFILQEMGREVNTMGSKSANPELTKIVIQVKDELEKMREQVQNIL